MGHVHSYMDVDPRLYFDHNFVSHSPIFKTFPKGVFKILTIEPCVSSIVRFHFDIVKNRVCEKRLPSGSKQTFMGSAFNVFTNKAALHQHKDPIA